MLKHATGANGKLVGKRQEWGEMEGIRE